MTKSNEGNAVIVEMLTDNKTHKHLISTDKYFISTDKQIWTDHHLIWTDKQIEPIQWIFSKTDSSNSKATMIEPNKQIDNHE